MPELVNETSFSTETYEMKSESHVLVLYVGGTIGMVRGSDGVYSPSAKTLVKLLRADPHMHDETYCVSKQGVTVNNGTTLALPAINKNRRIIYTIYEYETLIDSCDITSNHWNTIATDIYDNYTKYDGFVILHGTDTLSYTASALSFMLENLGKSVVLTGSQIPMCETRSDGIDNFIGSLIFAGNYTIPEVTIYFHNKLMRGNRTIKFSSTNLDPFKSPNATLIATMGTEIVVNYSEIKCPKTVEKFAIHTNLEKDVGLVRIFPNISLILVKSFLQSGLKGIVLQTFGCGNFTSSRKDLLLELENAVERGIIIVNCTQCFNGNVSDTYETGQVLTNIGVLSGGDMTSEAAFNKLSYILSKTEWDLRKKKQMFCTSLRGEMTTQAKDIAKEINFNLLMELKNVLGLTSDDEVKGFSNAILPALVIKAVKDENIQQLNMLNSIGANFNIPNEDNRTPLHFACCTGNVQLVQYLLRNGCMLHVKDSDNKTPLIDAIQHDNHQIIELLRKCGAHIPTSMENIGENLSRTATRGLVNRLASYHLAGVDLNSNDYSGRTPLHVAVINDNEEMLQFLLQHKVILKTDCFGETALDYAIKLKHTKFEVILLNYIESLTKP